MSFKTFDYKCTNEKCEQNEVKEERLVKSSEQESQKCKSCGESMTKLLGLGMVKLFDGLSK